MYSHFCCSAVCWSSQIIVPLAMMKRKHISSQQQKYTAANQQKERETVLQYFVHLMMMMMMRLMRLMMMKMKKKRRTGRSGCSGDALTVSLSLTEKVVHSTEVACLMMDTSSLWHKHALSCQLTNCAWLMANCVALSHSTDDRCCSCSCSCRWHRTIDGVFYY